MAIRTSMEAIEALPIFAAARARDDGHQAAEACTAKAERGWFDTGAAKAAILGLLADGQARSGEQLVDHCLRAGLVPHDSRAFGSVIGSLARAGAIEAVGYTERRKGHGTAGGRLWRAKHGR